MFFFLCFLFSFSCLSSKETHSVISHDGTKLCVEECGDKNGIPLLFIHGFSQSKSVWEKQISSGELKNYRLITFDLRGHGESDKPREKYNSSKVWADDIASIISFLGLSKPILVGWSYGGIVICDYLKHYGHQNIRGINLVGACTKFQCSEDAVLSYENETFAMKDIVSDRSDRMVRANSLFIQASFNEKPSIGDVYFFLGASAIVPNHMKLNIMKRVEDYRDLLPKINCPVLASYGEKDYLVPYLDQSLSRFPNSRLSLYKDCAHYTFWENSPRFNKELKEFVFSIEDSNKKSKSI